jgi:Legionella pneumophila major outer membrane protein precursor
LRTPCFFGDVLMMKFSMLAALTASSLFAANSQTAQPVRPYDYDLFSKDRECEYVDLEALVFKLLNNQPVGMKTNGPNQQGLDSSPNVSEKIVNMDWKWRPGFRVTVGYFNAPKYWEVMGQYTWFEDRGSKHMTTPSTGTDQYLRLGCYLPDYAPYTDSENPVTDIKASGHLYYNDFSAIVTRNFYPNPHLRLRVLGGLTSMWTHFSTKLNNTFYDGSEVNNLFHSKYWGVGFKMGTGADWYWGKDFYLTGKVFWSIVTGRWNTSTKVTDVDNNLLNRPYDSAYLTSQNFQFIFGPSYQKSYEKIRWELFVGYEFNSWLGALTTYNYDSHSYAQSWSYPHPFFENLTLTGVNVRLTLDF